MITLEEFVSAASQLENLELEWKWIDSTKIHIPNSLGEGYLERIELRPERIPEPSVNCSEEEKQEKLDDDLSVSTSAPPQIISWRFHICYSHSYREPVLYFQANEQSGTPLPFHRIVKQLKEQQQQLNNNISGSTDNGNFQLDSDQVSIESVPAISQEEHPVLHIPFYMLHPCQTGEIMALLSLTLPSSLKEENSPLPPLPSSPPPLLLSSSSSLQYLLAWLCVAGRPLKIAPSVSEYVTYMR